MPQQRVFPKITPRTVNDVLAFILPLYCGDIEIWVRGEGNRSYQGDPKERQVQAYLLPQIVEEMYVTVDGDLMLLLYTDDTSLKLTGPTIYSTVRGEESCGKAE